MNGKERGKLLRDEIFAAYEAAQTTRRPNRVRPSELGRQCTRSLWYSFRWADELKRFEGRMLRLFETGHSQEDRMIADLRRVGANVINRDPDNAKEQISLEALMGHLKGYLDSMAQNVPHAISDWLVVECKTHSDKSFKKLDTDGVQVAKPEHYGQMQLYMHEFKLPEALYVAVGKNDDDLYCEFVSYNQSYAERLMRKAEQVAFSEIAPERIHTSPDFYVCKMCAARSVCHLGQLPERNCRTCIDAKPVAGGWVCNHHFRTLTTEMQAQGCQDHRYHPEMVKGKLEDSDGLGTVIYKLDDGTQYVDTGPVGDTHPIARTA